KDELFQGLFVRFGQRLSRGIALFEETPLRKLFSNHVPIGCAGCLLELLGDVGADRVERTDRGRMRNGRSARSVRARQGAASGSLRGGNSSPRRVHQQLHGDRRARSLEHPATSRPSSRRRSRSSCALVRDELQQWVRRPEEPSPRCRITSVIRLRRCSVRRRMMPSGTRCSVDSGDLSLEAKLKIAHHFPKLARFLEFELSRK
ncbi:hypothetical protein PMAYCL1PPCAC_33409, partial [Pristionchus mayeri]